MKLGTAVRHHWDELIAWTVLTVVGITYLLLRLPMVETFVASVGQSPLLWLAQQAGEAWTFFDWPTGTRNLGKSLPMQVYRLAEPLGVSPIRIMQLYIVAEVAVGIASFRWAARRIAPAVGESGAAAIAIIAVLSAIGFANLARFAHPFQWGLYYAFAEAFRLVGVVGLGLGRWGLGFGALAAAVVVHPTVGGYGILAALPVVLLDQQRDFFSRRILVPAALAGGAALLWLVVSLDGVTVSAGGINPEDWYAFTRLFNSHWYPLHVGVLGPLGYKHALPFLAIVALGLRGMTEFPSDVRLRRFLFGVLTASLALTVLGLILSQMMWRPVLTKLALHRASELSIGIALIPGLALLWTDLREGGAVRRALAVVLLVSPFFSASEAVFPIVPALARAAPWSWPRTAGGRMRAAAWLIAVALAAALIAATPAISLSHRAVTGRSAWEALATTHTAVFVAFVVAVLMARWFRRTALLAVLVMLAGMSLKAEEARQAVLEKPQVAAWRSVLAALADKTPPDAFIMPDPSQPYGLRDLAHRASFGTLREWLMSAWQYDSDADLFAEGVRRFSIYGLDPAPYLQAPNVGWQAALALTNEIGRRHHAADEAFFRAVRKTWGVDYVIRRKLPDARPLQFESVYDNQFFEILRVDGPEPGAP